MRDREELIDHLLITGTMSPEEACEAFEDPLYRIAVGRDKSRERYRRRAERLWLLKEFDETAGQLSLDGERALTKKLADWMRGAKS